VSKHGKLILIAPQTPINSQAYKMAAGAQKALEETESYATWADFKLVHNSGLKIAMSARKGKQRKSFSLPEAYRQAVQEQDNQRLPIYLVFGCEDSGLASDDLDECHMTSFLPARGPFTSLNLAQAVILAQYIIAEEQEKTIYGHSSYQEGSLEARSEITQNLFPDDLFFEWLKTTGFTIDLKKENIYHTLRRMILRSAPTSKEIENLNKAFQQSLRKMLENEPDKGFNILNLKSAKDTESQ
jgi:tRNA (cytidine32/uridine32-2'-O)-methyltransferase